MQRGHLQDHDRPARCAIWHCTDCQTHTGSAFEVVVHVQNGAFTLSIGTLKVFTRIAESGRRRELSFCPECGTRIHARTPEDADAFFGLRVGTTPQRHLLRASPAGLVSLGFALRVRPPRYSCSEDHS